MTAIVVSLFLSFAATTAILPFYIKRLQILQWGQQIRPEGPEDHQKKSGTPTMGGAVVLLVFMCSLLWVRPLTGDYIAFMIIVLLNGAAGLFDDFIKIKKTRSLGLRARDKLFIQIILGIAMAYYMTKYTSLSGNVSIPFYGNIDLGWLFYPFCILVMTSFVNAVNLTDGLDGLASGTVIITLLGISIISYWLGRTDLLIGCMVVSGALLGFLVFNCFPARIFMGDTGSLALGGAVASLSILTGTEIYMVIMGAVFVMEALSVVIQVAYFKKTGGKRIFRMSPIHHHFALGGWHEVQVTTRFWIISVICTVLGVWLYRIKM